MRGALRENARWRGSARCRLASGRLSIPAHSRQSNVADSGWGSYLEHARIGRSGNYTLWVVYRFCKFNPQGFPGGVPLGPDFVQSALRGVVASNPLHVVVR